MPTGKKIDNWEKEFDEKFLNYVYKHQSKFLLPKNPSNQDTLEWLGKIERSLDKDIRDFIQEALTTQKESFIKIIRETRKNISMLIKRKKEKMKENEYKCAACGNIYEKGWTDEEAHKEANSIWGKIPTQDEVVICDDCFNKHDIQTIEEMGKEYKKTTEL